VDRDPSSRLISQPARHARGCDDKIARKSQFEPLRAELRSPLGGLKNDPGWHCFNGQIGPNSLDTTAILRSPTPHRCERPGKEGRLQWWQIRGVIPVKIAKTILLFSCLPLAPFELTGPDSTSRTSGDLSPVVESLDGHKKQSSSSIRSSEFARGHQKKKTGQSPTKLFDVEKTNAIRQRGNPGPAIAKPKQEKQDYSNHGSSEPPQSPKTVRKDESERSIVTARLNGEKPK